MAGMPGKEKGDNTEGGAMQLGTTIKMKVGSIEAGMTSKKKPVPDNKNYRGFSTKKK